MVNYSKEDYKKIRQGSEFEKITGGFKIGWDNEKNRLYLVFIGYIDDDIGSKFLDDFKIEIKKGKRNFDVIADLSEFRVASEEGEACIKKAMDLAADAGERNSARVGKKLRMGAIQLQKVADGIKSVDLKPKGYFKTIEEAEDYLDNFI